ncbi:HAD-IIA family hydrolase [Dermabacteraceae bacterium CCM 9519]
MAHPQHLPALSDLYDTLLLDLDGTLMNGSQPIRGASEGVAKARDKKLNIVFATNNASRSADQVIAHLETVGVSGYENEVITSVDVAMDLLRERFQPGDPVLIVGGPSLAQAVAKAGFTAVRSAQENPVAVVQGWSADVGWPQLAEGAYAINRGATFIATNVDRTLPTEYGMAPGNGSLVQALVHATGVTPLVAGKPQPALFTVAAQRCAAARPVAVGDRLDTDIEGGNRAGIDTILVLTGVSGIDDALRAEPLLRPSHLISDMLGLHEPYQGAVAAADAYRCGRVSARFAGEDIVISGVLDKDSLLQAGRAALALVATLNDAWNGRVLDETGKDIAFA